MRRVAQKITAALSAWQQRHAGDNVFLYVAAALIGLMSGAAAAMLKWGVGEVKQLVYGASHISAGNWAFFLLPVIGILIATAYTKYVARRPMDHASDRIARNMASGDNDMSPRLILGPIIACSFTLGMGGSAGAEDPIAGTGAAIGSNVGKAFKLPQEGLAQLVGCGAAAGIAGIFMAPIGGVMFALEVLKMRQTLSTILAIIISSLTAAITCYVLMGFHYDVTFVPDITLNLKLIPYVLLCGLFCGLYSSYYSHVMAFCRAQFKRVGNIWLRALTGGALVAVMLFFFPSLYGEGYETLSKLMVDDPRSIVIYSPLYKMSASYLPLVLLMAALLLVKPFATSATNDSGGIGGDFTPTFFCGGIAGFLFASVLNRYAGLSLPLPLFAFFGMAAVMSGAVRAPLMAIFITAEMTGLYGFIMPLTFCAAASVLTAMSLSRMRLQPLPFLHRHEPKQPPSS